MSNLTIWNDPWSVFDELSGLRGRALGAVPAGRPLTDVWGNDDEVIVEVELPGANPENVSISVEDDLVTIEGEVPEATPAEGQTLYRRERRSGAFSRSVRLPFPANPEQVKATYTNGVLRVAVPRSETSKPHRIKIEAA